MDNAASDNGASGASSLSLAVEGQYRSGKGISQLVQMREIWREGCRFQQVRIPNPGTSISLRVGEFGPFDAVVGETVNRLTEVRFVRPIYQPIFDLIVQQYAGRVSDTFALEFKRRAPFDDALLNRRV